jgi:hypothetical protein
MPTREPRQIDPNLDQSIEDRGETPENRREEQTESVETTDNENSNDDPKA